MMLLLLLLPLLLLSLEEYVAVGVRLPQLLLQLVVVHLLHLLVLDRHLVG